MFLKKLCYRKHLNLVQFSLKVLMTPHWAAGNSATLGWNRFWKCTARWGVTSNGIFHIFVKRWKYLSVLYSVEVPTVKWAFRDNWNGKYRINTQKQDWTVPKTRLNCHNKNNLALDNKVHVVLLMQVSAMDAKWGDFIQKSNTTWTRYG